jgi:hypothetical protein
MYADDMLGYSLCESLPTWHGPVRERADEHDRVLARSLVRFLELTTRAEYGADIFKRSAWAVGFLGSRYPDMYPYLLDEARKTANPEVVSDIVASEVTANAVGSPTSRADRVYNRDGELCWFPLRKGDTGMPHQIAGVLYAALGPHRAHALRVVLEQYLTSADAANDTMLGGLLRALQNVDGQAPSMLPFMASAAHAARPRWGDDTDDEPNGNDPYRPLERIAIEAYKQFGSTVQELCRGFGFDEDTFLLFVTGGYGFERAWPPAGVAYGLVPASAPDPPSWR